MYIMIIFKKKNVILYSVIFIIIMEISCLFLMSNYKTKTITLEDKNDIFNTDSTIAILLGDENGEYTESTSTKWPTDGSYIYNSEISGCTDSNGNILDNVLSFDTNTMTASLNTTTTTYCYLYFDLDTTPPKPFTFYLGGSSNPTYIGTTSINVYLSWTDKDIASYCIIDDGTIDNCTWTSASGTSVVGTYTLSSGDGTKTAYAYLKDKAGNTSEKEVDTIIVDTFAPVVTNAKNAGAGKVTFSATDSNSGVYQYCVNTNSTSTSNCSWKSAKEGVNTTSKIVTTAGVYYVHVKDKAGNIGHSSSFTMILECTNGLAFGECLMNVPTTGLTITEEEGGLYRYQGTTADNYVCFGTSDKDTCLEDTNIYLYRVMGVNSSNQAVLIKNDVLEEQFYWTEHGSTSGQYWQDHSNDVNAALNGSSFLYNTTYIPEGWRDKIVSRRWPYGTISSDFLYSEYATAKSMYTQEAGGSAGSSYGTKIGLMYLYDYYYGLKGGNNCYKNSSVCNTSWIYSPGTNEWVISHAGRKTSNDGTYYYFTTWSIGTGPAGVVYMEAELDGSVYTLHRDSYYKKSVRPVFYLATTVKYISGSGTLTNPFIIE